VDWEKISRKIIFKYLPIFIKKLKNLESLNLADYNLRNLPKEISHLKNLKDLNLNNNKLRNLPKEIGKLKSLLSLTLSNNLLTNIPEDIRELKNLRKLSLKRNQLNKLPKEIGELKKLKVLILSKNKFTALSKEIGELKNLSELVLSSNKIDKLPKEMGKLKSLKRLILNNNNIKELPNELKGILKLKDLSLSENNLKILPNEICQLDLKKIDLWGNRNLNTCGKNAINFKNGLEEYWLNGVRIPKEYGIYDPEDWKAEWILTEKNAEVRRVLIQVIGYEKIMNKLGSQIINSSVDHNGNNMEIRRVRNNVDVEPIHLLKVVCPSTGKTHVLRVPPNMTSCEEARRWTFFDLNSEFEIITEA